MRMRMELVWVALSLGVLVGCHHGEAIVAPPDLADVVGVGDLATAETPDDLGKKKKDLATPVTGDLASASDLATAQPDDLALVPTPTPDPDGLVWEWLNPLPTGEALSSVYSDGTRVWAAGWRGTVLYSTDGTHFVLGATGTHENLNGIWGSGNEVYAVGEHGTLLHSTNGGAAFAKVDVGVPTLALNGVYGVDGRVFVVGEGPTFLYGSGSTFSSTKLPDSAGTLGTVWARSPSDVWIAGLWGHIHHAQNAVDYSDFTLVTWANGDFRSMTGDATNLWLAGEGGWGGYSHFDGTKWIHRDLEPGVARQWFGVWPAAANDVYLTTEDGRLSYSDDDFASYSSKQLDTTSVLTGIWGSGDNVYVVGRGAAVLRSTDHAKTFSSLLDKKVTTKELFSKLYASSEDNLFLAGSATLLRSTNAGVDWTALPIATTGITNIASIAGRPDGTLVVSGGGVGLYAFAYSKNYGASFTVNTKQPTFSSMTMRGDAVYGVGSKCELNYAAHPGDAFSTIAIPDTCYFSLVYSDGTNVIAGGYNQPTYYSADGKTFKKASVEGNHSIHYIWAAPDGDLWGTSFWGVVLRSHDAGATWVNVPTGLTEADGHLSFIGGPSADEIYAFDTGAWTGIVTKDHGASWQRVNAPPWSWVAYAGPEHLISAGNNGAIVRHTY